MLFRSTGSVIIENNTFSNWAIIGGSSVSGVFGISNLANAASLNIENNTFTGWTFAAAAPCSLIYINQAGMVSGPCVIRRNTIGNNVGLNTSQPVMFIANSTNSQTVVCVSNVITNNRNLAGDSQMFGYYSLVSSVNGAERIDSNDVSNLSNGGTIYGIYSNNRSDITVVGNSIKAFSGAGAVNGIICGGTTLTISGNVIDSLLGNSVTGIGVISGTTASISKCKVTGLSSQNESALVTGISVSSGSNSYVENNVVAGLFAPNSHLSNAVTGVNISSLSKAYIYYNTVFLNGTGSASTFGSAALTASTTPVIDLRNNILINNTLPGNGSSTIKSIAYKRTGTLLSTHGALSNNNLFYVNPQASGKALFSDGINIDSTLSAVKKRFAPRESVSISELPVFVNAIAAPYDLRLNICVPTLVESGGTQVLSPSAVVDDINGNIRALEAGYNGTGTAPDLGAFECAGMNAYSLNLTALIGGSYNQAANTMRPDTITVELHNKSALCETVTSGCALFSAAGNAQIHFKAADRLTDSYYVVLKHRACIETWSSAGIAFNCGSADYDFTNANSKSFGNNLQKRGEKYCLYSGDVDQSGFIDNNDLRLIDNDAYGFKNGYLVTDLDGNRFVDNNDLLICDNNAYNFIGKCTPVGTKSGVISTGNTLQSTVSETNAGTRKSFIKHKPPLK